MTLYEELTNAGVEIDSHESDLYFPRTDETKAILDNHPAQKNNASTFRNNINGEVWFDVPFSYDPFWEKRANNA
jgi:hypothetical protein